MLAITAITTRAQDNDLVIAEDATNQIAYATFKTDKNGNRISNSYSGDVVIPEKSPSGYPVTDINHHTFEGCVNLKSVKIPGTVKFIDHDAFRKSSLTEITCLATVPPACGNSGVFYHVNKEQCKLLVPEGSIDAYKAAEVWKEFFNIEPTGINRVEADASAAGWYSINGQRSSSARKGLNIMRTADGKTRKVIIR